MITSLTYSSKPRKKIYKEGDIRMIKGVMHVKRPRVIRKPNGKMAGYDCGNGHQRYMWVPVSFTVEQRLAVGCV